MRGAGGLIDFLKRGFGAQEMQVMRGADGTVGHASVRIGDSAVMMGEAGERWTPVPAMLYLYVEDADATWRRALDAGATSIREPVDEFYGDRVAAVADGWGNQWWIATHREDLDEAELQRRAQARSAGP